MALLNSGVQTGVAWAKESVMLIKANLHQWLMVSFAYLLIFMMLPSMPHMTLLAIPIMIIWPAFTVMVMMMFRNQVANRQEALADLIDRLKPKLKALCILGAVCFAYAVLATLFLNADIQALLVNSKSSMSESESLQYMQALLPVMLKLLLLLAPMFLVTWFSPMLIALHDYPLVKALKSSIAGVLQFTLALGVAWAVLFVTIMILLMVTGMVLGIVSALVPALGKFLMLVVVFAVVLLGTALMFAFQYVSYRDIFKAAPVTLA